MCTFNISSMADEVRPKRIGRGKKKPSLLDDYEIFGDVVLGKGSYGVVKKCRRRGGKKFHAVKIIKKDSLTSAELEAVQSEVEVQVQLQHHHIVPIIATYETPQYLHIVMEYMQGGQLRDDFSYAESTAKRIARSLLAAVAFMHSHGIVHRDLKPANLLLPDRESLNGLKVSDFGFARLVGSDHHLTSTTGTHSFMAPEIVSGQNAYGLPVDMWSVGVILYLVLAGELPFQGATSAELTRAISEDPPDMAKNPVWEKISPSGKAFLSACLTKDPVERITAKAAVLHPWVNEVVRGNAIEEHLDMVSDLARIKGGAGGDRSASGAGHISTGNPIYDFLNNKPHFTELDLTSSCTEGTAPEGTYDLSSVLTLLRHNKTLGFVSLSGLGLTDAQVFGVISALSTHPAITTLDISNNPSVTSAPSKALQNLRRKSASLRCVLYHNTGLVVGPAAGTAVSAGAAAAAAVQKSSSRPFTAPYRPMHRSSRSAVASSTRGKPRQSVFMRLRADSREPGRR